MTGRRRHPVDEREWASPEMGEVRLASRLELAHTFGQEPQRPVQAQVLVDALHRTGALMAAVGRASTQPPFDEVLLDLCGRRAYVEHRRQTVVSTRAMLFFST